MNMKALGRKLGAKQGSKHLGTENFFHVKYVGCATKLEKDDIVVQKALTKLLAHEKKSTINYLLRITDTEVLLIPNRRSSNHNNGFSIPIGNFSYAFFPKKNHYMLALNKHVSNTEVECYVVRCKSRERKISIDYAFHFAFKERHFALLRDKRERETEHLMTRLRGNSFQQKDREIREDTVIQSNAGPVINTGKTQGNNNVNEHTYTRQTMVDIHKRKVMQNGTKSRDRDDRIGKRFVEMQSDGESGPAVTAKHRSTMC